MIKSRTFIAFVMTTVMMIPGMLFAKQNSCAHSSYAYNATSEKVECQNCHEEIDDYNRVIIYTSNDASVVAPYSTTVFGATLKSNTYVDGKGVITFSSSVTKIGYQAFYTKSKITSLLLPSSVNQIGTDAFSYCTRLTGKLLLPYGVTKIGSGAFSNCSSSLSIVLNSIPYNFSTAFSNVSASIELCLVDKSYICYYTSIPTISSAKYTCSDGNAWGIGMVPFKTNSVTDKIQLYSITSASDANGKVYLQTESSVEANTPFIYHVLDGASEVVFNMASGTTVQAPTSSTYYKTVGDYSLYGTYASNTLTAGGTSTYYALGTNSFGKVTTSATIPAMHGWFQKNEADCSVSSYSFVSQLYQLAYKSKNGVITPNSTDFGTAGSLISNTCDYNGNGIITFDAPITTIPANAFKDNTDLTSITIPNTVTSIDVNAFYYCTSLSSVNLPEGLTSIGGQSFLKCSNLSCSLVLPSTLQVVGASAFQYCSNITGLTLNQGLKTIGISAFSGLTNAKNTLTIPSTVTAIGQTAFASCGFTGSVTVPATVTFLSPKVFYQCTGITSVVMQRPLTQYLFDGCTNLSSVTLLSTETTIPSFAFLNCSNLTSITLPTSVTAINEKAFSGSGLTSISIPNAVTSIGVSAFYNCKDLATVNFVSIPQISSSAFTSIKSNAQYNVTLSDASNLYIGENNFPTSVSASYTRNMSASSEWGTAILPFGVRCYQSTQFQFYTLSSSSIDSEGTDGVMMFRRTDDYIKPNTPFIYKKKVENATSVTFTGSTVAAPLYENYGYVIGASGDAWTIEGTYKALPTVSNVYYMAANKVWYAESNISVKPFRAYFLNDAISVNAPASGIRLMIEDESEEATTILEMAADGSVKEVPADGIYDLQGRKVASPNKSIYVKNGKKIMIK